MHSINQEDKRVPQETFIDSIVDSYLDERNVEVSEKITKGQEMLFNVMTLGLGSSEEPLQKVEKFLNPDKQRQMYDSLTDFLADVLIRIEKKT